MFYIVYQITNQTNGKIYIGCHQTADVDDGYMGSGSHLQNAIRKYGLSNFTKTILHTFSNPDDMFTKEAELVTEDFCARADTYNLKVGGSGGWDFINRHGLRPLPASPSSETRSKISIAVRQARERRRLDAHWSAENSRKISTALRERYKTTPHHTKGIPKSPIQRQRMSASAKKNNGGSGNPNFGKRWITKNGKTISVPSTELSHHIENGWSLGRK